MRCHYNNTTTTNNNIIIIITNNNEDVDVKAIVRVRPVHLINVDQSQVAATLADRLGPLVHL